MTARDDLVRLTKDAVTRVDAAFRDLARRVVAFTRAFGPLTNVTLPAYRAGLRRILAPVFGLTKAAGETAVLFTTISGALAPAFDAPFRAVFTRLRSLVERRAPGAWPAIERGLLTGAGEDRMSLAYRLLYGPNVEQARLRRALGFDANRVWVRGDGTPYRLSDRIWRAGVDVRNAIDERIRLGLARGDDALKIAADLDRYLNPQYAPVRYLQDGRIIRRNMTLAPGRGGYGGTHARVLARTEVSRAHSQATVEMAKNTLGVTGIQWQISGRHPRADRCDYHANADNGMGRGVYTPETFPRMPEHPSCLCCAVPVVASRDEVVRQIIARYGGA